MTIAGVNAQSMGNIERFLRKPEQVQQWSEKALANLEAQHARGQNVQFQKKLVDWAKKAGEKLTAFDYADFSSQRFFKLGRPSLVAPASGWLILLASFSMIGSRATMGFIRDQRARKEGRIANEVRDVILRDIWASFWFFFGMEIIKNGFTSTLKKLTGIDLKPPGSAGKPGDMLNYDSLATNFKVNNRNVMAAIVKDASARHGFFNALPSLDKLTQIHESFKVPLDNFKVSAFELKQALAKLGTNVEQNPKLEALISKTYDHFKQLTEARDRILLSFKQQPSFKGAAADKLQKAMKIEQLVADHIGNKVRLPLDMLSMGFVWVILGLLPVAVNKVLGDRDVARHLQEQKTSVALTSKHASSPQNAHHQNALKHPLMGPVNAFALNPALNLAPNQVLHQ
ncbi:MAG: hypothetical protein VKK59_05455, partial [Vampirovibrionales bacterium]|nr:hypothetical protein [Vampirovibrionales bacterium]